MTALLYDILFLLPPILAVYSVAVPFVLPDEAALLPAAYVIPSGVFSLCIAFKHLKNRGRIILCGILLAAVTAYILSLPSGERIESLLEYRFGILLCLMILGVYIGGEILNRFMRVRLAAALISAAALPVALINGYSAGKMCVCMVFIYLLLNITDMFQLHSQKEGDTEGKKHLVSVSPFILAAFLVFAVLPVPEKPYDWAVVKRIGTLAWEAACELADRLFTEPESDEAFIGFSGRGDFAGKIKKKDSVALKLHATMGYDTSLYLAGKTFADFTGRSWEDDTEEAADFRFDAIESVCAVFEDYEEGGQNDALMRVNMTVTYRQVSKKTVFLPPKAYIMSEGTEADPYTYKSAYLRLNRREDIFGELADRREEISPEAWNAAAKYLGLQDETSLSYEAYLKYRQDIRDKYTETPGLSEEASEYLAERLEGAESALDKCLKIEELLQEGKYSNEPGELPEGINDAAGYLDHFLFEKTEGYCSHYATAFVLMARSLGMPARFVQGFRTRLGRNGESEVKSEAAHAWPEVYFEGVGWIIFEPTPGYDNKSGWKTMEEISAEAGRGSNVIPDDAGKPEETGDETVLEEDGKTAAHIPWERILIPVLAGGILAVILFLFDCLYKKKRYNAMSERDKCLFLCRMQLAAFRKLGYARDECETIAEFRERAREAVSGEYLDFLDIYERLLYAGEVADETMRKSLEDGEKPLKAYIRKRKKELREEALYEDDEQALDF